ATADHDQQEGEEQRRERELPVPGRRCRHREADRLVNGLGRRYSRGMAIKTASGTDPLAAGRAALERAEWCEARAILEEATAGDGSAEAWDGLSRAAWWLGDEAATFAARERAFRAYREGGDVEGAATMAMWIA